MVSSIALAHSPSRAVGVDALPCRSGQVAYGGRQHSSPSRFGTLRRCNDELRTVSIFPLFHALAGCGRRCATLSWWTGSLWWPTTQLAISHRTFIVDERGAGYPQMHWRILGSLEVSLAHVLSGIAVGILSLVLRTVISRGRDEYGAVEKTLKGILNVCTVLVFPVVVALFLEVSERMTVGVAQSVLDRVWPPS